MSRTRQELVGAVGDPVEAVARAGARGGGAPSTNAAHVVERLRTVESVGAVSVVAGPVRERALGRAGLGATEAVVMVDPLSTPHTVQ